MPRRHILFALPALSGGGAERVSLELLRHLDRKRFAPLLVLTGRGGALRGDVPPDVRVVELGAPRTLLAAPALAGLIRRERPDVVFSTLGHLNLLLRLLAPVLPRGTALIARENNIPSLNLRRLARPWLFHFLYRRLYPGFFRVICQSHDMLRDLVENYGVPPEKCVVIPNPVDAARLRRMAVEGESGLPSGALNILACGRLAPQKGFDLLLRAFALLDDSGMSPAPRLTILGEGPERGALAALARELGVADRVSLPGFAANPYPAMAACDLFALSSRYEGLPNVLLEALSLGARVAAFDCPGDVARILEGMPACRLARPGDPSSLAEAMRGALIEQRRPEEAVRLVEERHGAKGITRRFEGVFLEAVS